MAGILSFPATAGAAKNQCHSHGCVVRVANRRCSNRHVVACIVYAAWRYRQPLGDALRVARCESSLDPHNSYLGHYGLFQFLQSTFNTTIYRGHDIWSARWNSLAAMWTWAHSRRNEWQCQ